MTMETRMAMASEPFEPCGETETNVGAPGFLGDDPEMMVFFLEKQLTS